MKEEEFGKLVKARLDKCIGTLVLKNKEYSSDVDRLHNFKQAGRARGVSPEEALSGMLMKHLVSMWDMIDDIEYKVPIQRTVSEKLGDIINYVLLLEALITERRGEGEPCE